MRRNGLFSLIFVVVLTFAGVVGTLVSGNEPLLGLDLQGGVSVVLEPTGEADSSTLDQSIEIIRQRVDAVGVAEPEISRQGSTIVVALPGISDRDRVLQLVGQTAELRFRPVLGLLPPQMSVDAGIDDGDGEVDGDDPVDGDADDADVDGEADDGVDDGADEVDDGVDAPDDAADDDSAAPSGIRRGVGQDPDEVPGQDDAEFDDLDLDEFDLDGLDLDGLDLDGLDGLDGLDMGGDQPLTTAEDDLAEEEVLLASYDSSGNETLRYRLGPVPGAEGLESPTIAVSAPLTGEILNTARAQLNQVGEWVVNLRVRGARIDDFNAAAAECYNGGAHCPPQASSDGSVSRGQLAIVLDGRVESAPSINAPAFRADEVQISGNFSEREAKDLALVLRYGALPVELEAQQTQTVSATLGRDALEAGVIAGLIGLGLVALYMVAVYRLMGLVAIASLGLSAAMLWVVIAYLGETQGLALTLAGVTGILVSIGVAVDSNVVFYEHLREAVWNGRTMRTAVDSSFKSAFSTIVKADVASLIGAIILYYLTVGPVRGFALYLAVGTVLDLIASYFFMRPMTFMVARSHRLQNRPRLTGMPQPSGVAVAEKAAPA